MAYNVQNAGRNVLREKKKTKAQKKKLARGKQKKLHLKYTDFDEKGKRKLWADGQEDRA